MLLLGNVLKEIMDLLIKRQATLGGVFEAFCLLVPFVLVFSLPMGMMTRRPPRVWPVQRADQELTAVRSSGISLVALVTPILILESLPLRPQLVGSTSRNSGPQMPRRLQKSAERNALKISASALPEGRYVKQKFDSHDFIFYIGRNDGQNLRDISICRYDLNGDPDLYVIAPRGAVVNTNEQSFVTLYDQQTFERQDNGTWMTLFAPSATAPLNFNKTNSDDTKPGISDMTFGQLRAELRNLDHSFSVPDEHKLSGEELRKQKQQMEHMRKDLTLLKRACN